MKLNQNIQLIGEKVILVPYVKQHVLKYHEWMKDKELQTLTCSEPLTLEEEYQMQRSWLEDEDKCTFILLDASLRDEHMDSSCDIITGMCGDVNIFISKKELELDDKIDNEEGIEEDDIENKDGKDNVDHDGMKSSCGDSIGLKRQKGFETIGEIEIMIAEKKSRRKGIATEALYMMMYYGYKNLGIEKFIAKIVEQNQSSLHLFQNKLHGFKMSSYSKVFQEFEFQLDLKSNQSNQKFLEEQNKHTKQIPLNKTNL